MLARQSEEEFAIRHTANNWMKSGFSYEVRSDVLGHAVQEINMDYAHADAQSLAEAVGAIWLVEQRGYPRQVIRLSWGTKQSGPVNSNDPSSGASVAAL